MTDQNEREWPSFGDILDELNSLGGLKSTTALSADKASVEPLPAPVDERADAIPDSESIPSDPDDLDAEPKWASLETGEELPTFDELGSAPVEPDSSEEAAFALALGDDIDWSSWEFDAAATPPPNALSQQFTPEPSSDDAPPAEQSPIFEFDMSAVGAEPDVDSSGLPGIDGEPIDSVATADAIETDLNELFGMVEVDESDSDEGLDSQIEDPADADDLAALAPVPVLDADHAAAEPDLGETIEPELEELVDEDSDSATADNVVPLHRPDEDLTHHLVGLDDVFDPAKPRAAEAASSAAEFVSIEEDVPETADSWDYLRPDEDEAPSSGVFSRRPKFFGGGERKARKTERKQAEAKAEASGPPCPKCDATGRVDLNDPIGGKIHCSCLECDHVWSELAPRTQESA
ncbi:MAG: hypothetical protein HKO87_08570 [Acidimicrobiia bacterium]|nr:hypothetical protein [Acidimicrobiia bacterium]